MGISEREHHVKVLENLLSHYKAREKCEGYYDSTLKDNVEALQYAISSLKTDLKYDLMYEGENVYTKADMVAMLIELKNKLIDKSWNIDMYDDDLDFECCYLKDIDEVIQEKINALKGEIC